MDSPLAIVAIIVAVVGFCVQYFGLITKIQHRLVAIETKMDLVWRIVENKMTDLLHSATNPRKDYLLVKMKEHAITREEAVELRKILLNEMNNADRKHLLVATTFVTAWLEQIIDDGGRH